MRQVVAQIKVKLGQFGPEAHSNFQMVQNEENTLTSVTLDKNNAKYNFYGSCEGSSTCKYIDEMLSKCQTRWADNDKGSKMRKHINIRVNSKIPVHIIIIINQNSHVSQLFTSLKSLVWGMTRLDVCYDVTHSFSTNYKTATEIFCVEMR